MRHTYLALILAFLPLFTSYATECSQPLAPQALIDLSQMHQTIEAAHENNEDSLYIKALESAFHLKFEEHLKQLPLSRAQLITILQKQMQKSNIQNSKKYSSSDLEHIKQALAYHQKRQTTLGHSFILLIQEGPLFGDGDVEIKKERYFSRIKGFLLLAANADALKVSFNLNELVTELYTTPFSDEKRTTTVLHEAIAHRLSKEIIEAIITAGAELDIQNSEGETPLHIACIKNNPEIVDLLLNAGADLRIKDNRGATPLHRATEVKNLEIAQILLTHGSDVNAKASRLALTAMETAILDRSSDLTKLFITSGADVIHWVHIPKLIRVAGIKHTLQLYTGKFRQKKAVP